MYWIYSLFVKYGVKSCLLVLLWQPLTSSSIPIDGWHQKFPFLSCHQVCLPLQPGSIQRSTTRSWGWFFVNHLMRRRWPWKLVEINIKISNLDRQKVHSNRKHDEKYETELNRGKWPRICGRSYGQDNQRCKALHRTSTSFRFIKVSLQNRHPLAIAL